MCHTLLRLAFIIDLLMNSSNNLIRLCLVLKHCFGMSLHVPLCVILGEENLQKDNSSKVRPAVSGKKKKIKTSSNANQQQYTRSQRHLILSRPTGFTYVAKNAAPRP